ncbi:uncharacterized protein LOC121864977 [Homarus americanus]|uniref:uncharacterized protein LOC121864977 n=1 Tax=Homarus americanus TaxID=6706 RepID=UPI001C4465D6|nr:uncharacterized protein LOC121864977 [Homarus americanus]
MWTSTANTTPATVMDRVWCVLWVGVVTVAGTGGRVMPLLQELEASDGCGPNPLTVVVAAGNDLGHLEAVEVMAVLESDPETWGEFLALIHAYDDCVRTGQLRFKRMAPPPLRRSASLAGPAALRLHNASKSTSSDLSAQPRSSFSQQHLLYRLLQHQDPPSRSLDHHRHIQA